MSRNRLPLVLHLGSDEIAQRYRSCKHAVEKTHWQVIFLLTRDEPTPLPVVVAKQVGMTPAWVRTILKRWNDHGADGLSDRRLRNGANLKLDATQRAELFETLKRPPDDGGLWSGRKVAEHVRRRYGVAVCKQTGWEWLRRLGFTLQVPRPRHPQAAGSKEQDDWKRRRQETP